MRIGIVTPAFSAAEDDWCIPVLLDLARILAQTDDVTVYSFRYPLHARPYRTFGAEVVPFGGGQVRGLPRIPFSLRIAARLPREVRARRLDVLHAMWAHEPGFAATWVGRRLGIPTVVSLLGGELVDLPDIDYGGRLTAINRFLVDSALRHADRVVVGSRFQFDLARAKVDAARLVHQPMGIDGAMFRPLAGPELSDPELEAERLDGAPCLVHVGSMCPVKDHDTLLHAFRRILDGLPEARLHLFGDGDLRPGLEALRESLGLSHAVRFHGAVRRESLPALLSQADLQLFSSRSENSAMAVIEAAACGCPTVGTAVGAVPDFSDFCVSVPTRDPQALAGEALALLRDRERLKAMSDVGIARGRTDLGIRHSAEAFRAIYRDVIEARRATRSS